MNADEFALGIVARYNRRASWYNASGLSGDAKAEPLDAVGSAAVVLAILRAIVAGCDLLNPGWRPFGPPPEERLRRRAAAAYDPSSAGFFGRSQARRDRRAIAYHVLRHGHKASVHVETMTDAIIDAVLHADDATIERSVKELAAS